jgi:hypothetical protein
VFPQKNKQNGLSSEFLERCHKGGNEFLNNIVRVTRDETLVSFANVGTKRIYRAVDAHTFTKQAEEV